MFYLIYMSKAAKLMHDEDLNAVLQESRDWNQSHGITGMLLYIRGNILGHAEGRFIQALEGTEAEVKGIFESIKNDKRHDNITLLNQGSIKKRNFETWLMGFESLSIEELQSKEGFFELNDQFLDSGKLKGLNVALNFLKNFYTLSLNPKS